MGKLRKQKVAEHNKAVREKNIAEAAAAKQKPVQPAPPVVEEPKPEPKPEPEPKKVEAKKASPKKPAVKKPVAKKVPAKKKED